MPLPKTSALHCVDCAALFRLARRNLVKLIACDACGGTGTIVVPRARAVEIEGRAMIERHCGVCHGTGVVSDPPAHIAIRDAENAGIETVYR